ncbi:MAG: phosphatase PAP2 family protein [Bacteroidales bacterium]|nr:phosphatase PAP2 family protein [Bacteroidales bacterium]
MIDTLNTLDHELMLWLNYDGGTFQDAFWYTLSQIPSWIPLYITIIFVMLQPSDGQKQKRWMKFILLLLFTALVFAFTDQISAGIIKPLVQRPRPSHDGSIMDQLHFVNDYHGGAYGFVSSHAANCFGLAVWVSCLYKRRSLVTAMMLYAVLNCYSRIYLGVHFPGDIICGTILGILCGWLGYYCYTRFCQRFSIPQNKSVNPLPITIMLWASLLAFAVYAMFKLFQ